MKICLTTEHYSPHVGGVEIVFQEYAKRLSQRGHQVRIVTSNSGGITGQKKINNKLTIYYLQCSSFFNHPVFSKKQLSAHIQWADIIHTTTFTAALPSVSLAKKYKKPCILMVHEVLREKWFTVEKNPLKVLAFLFFEWYVINKKYTLWQVISMSTKEDLLKYSIPENKIRTIYHGIDYKLWNKNVSKKSLTKLFKVLTSKKIILYNGRPGQTKGIFVLLDAIKKIKSKLPKDFIFGFIISDTPEQERRKFIKLVKKNKLTNVIKITKALPYDQLPSYRKDAFAFVVPSITEGFGFTTAETSALDIPLIVSDVGSIPEVASGKVLFFKNRDSTDLSKKILLAIKNKFNNITLKKFNWDNTINKVEKIYTESVNSKQTKGNK